MRSLCCVVLLLVSAGDGLAQPPTDGWLVWERGAAAAEQPRRIWISRLDGSNKRPLTDEGSRLPTWSPDGRWISYYNEAEDSGRILRLDGSDDRKICDGRPLF